MSEFNADNVRKLIKHNRVLESIWRKQSRAAKMNEEGALKAVYNAFIIRDPVMFELYQSIQPQTND